MKKNKAAMIRGVLAGSIMMAGCLFGITAKADYAGTVLSQQPKGYWRFSETSPVLSFSPSAINLGSLGASRNGTYKGDLAGRGFAGIIAGDSAAHFNGSSEYLTVPWAASLNTTTTWSSEAWWSPDSINNGATLGLVMGSLHDASTRRGWLIYQQTLGTSSALSLRFYYGAGTAFDSVVASAPTNASGTFIHLVLTYNNKIVKLYTNGVLSVSNTIPNGVAINDDSDFLFGSRSGVNSDACTIDEPAYYGTELTAAQVKAHYDALTTNNAGYASQILADNPLFYFRLNEAPLQSTANSGILGAAKKGTLVYPITSANSGPSSPTFPGFEATNVSIASSGGEASMGTGGYVSTPALGLNTNAITITGWLKPNGAQVANAGAIMVRSSLKAPTLGDTAGLVFDQAPGLNLSYNWDGDNATYSWNSGQSLIDGAWNFVSLIVKPNEAIIFAPGSNTDPATNSHTHAVLAFTGNTYIGTDIAKSGFNGGLDEVAVFGRALSVGEVYTEYATAVGGKAPRIFTDPAAPTDPLYAGDSLALSVDGGGTAPITYAWRKNGLAIIGATNASFTATNLTAGGPDTYDVIVTGLSSITSAGAVVTVLPAITPIITQDIIVTNRLIYTGGAIKLNVVATGGGGLGYQWSHAGTNIPGKTASSLILNSITNSDGGSYQVAISNSVSTVYSSVATITVPTPVAGTYEASITADGPVSWWRLNDAPGSTNLLDSKGRNDGYWNGSVVLGASGALTNNTDTAATFSSGSWGELPSLPPPAANGDYTFEIWVRPTDSIGTQSTPFSSFRPRYGYYITKNTDGTWRSHDGYGDLDGATISRQALMGNVSINTWVHLVMLYSAATGSRVYINGQWDGNSYVDHCRNANTPMRIGAIDPLQQSGLRQFFTGDIDEIAVYDKALSLSQIQAHYFSGLYNTNTPPIFVQQPQVQTVAFGRPVTFSVLMGGSPPIALQWYTNLIAVGGATNTAISIASANYSSAIGMTYYCVATNISGSVTSSVATLTVTPSPAFVNLTNNLVLHLKFDGDFTDSSGKGHDATAMGSPSITPGIVGSGSLRYSTTVDGGGGHGGNVIEANYLTLGTFPLAGVGDLSFSNNINFSVAYWVKSPTNASSGDLPFFSSALNSYGNYGLTFAPTYSSSRAGGWSWSLGDGATYAGLYGAANSINDGAWHYLAHTFNRANGDGITYLDGAFVSNNGISVLDDIDSGNPFTIGQDPTGQYNEAATNYLDDLAVWKGRVLTANEVYDAYYVGKTYGKSFDVISPITIQLVVVGGNNQIVWQAGTLYWANDVTGPFTPVPGATPPYYQITPTGDKKFFRVQ